MSNARISRWARRFLLVSATWFVAAEGAFLAGAPRRVGIYLGLYGFVLTTVFGKAYSLIPSYFDRTLAWPSAPAVQLPLTTAGVGFLAVAAGNVGPPWLGAVGGLAWAGGVAVFLGTMVLTVGGNLTGAETATGDGKSERQRLDRLANAFIPLVLVYLAVGTVELLGATVGLVSPFGGLSVRTSHLLGAGVALLLLFSIGYRLLPRFLGVQTSPLLAGIVLPAGALGPALLAWGYPAGPVFRAGAAVQSLAVVGFAGGYLRMIFRTDRERVGLYSVAIGVCFGVLGVALGLYFAFEGITAELVALHWRVNLFGLLGLSIVGAVYQFYPPALCPWPGGSDRTALLTVGLVAGGLLVFALGTVTGAVPRALGVTLTLLGAAGYTYLLAGTITYQTSNRG